MSDNSPMSNPVAEAQAVLEWMDQTWTDLPNGQWNTIKAHLATMIALNRTLLEPAPYADVAEIEMPPDVQDMLDELRLECGPGGVTRLTNEAADMLQRFVYASIRKSIESERQSAALAARDERVRVLEEEITRLKSDERKRISDLYLYGEKP